MLNPNGLVETAALKLHATLLAFGVDLTTKKIQAIKYIRTETNCGLKEAKDGWEWAVEEADRIKERQRTELHNLCQQRDEISRRIDVLRAQVGW